MKPPAVGKVVGQGLKRKRGKKLLDHSQKEGGGRVGKVFGERLGGGARVADVDEFSLSSLR